MWMDMAEDSVKWAVEGGGIGISTVGCPGSAVGVIGACCRMMYHIHTCRKSVESHESEQECSRLIPSLCILVDHCRISLCLLLYYCVPDLVFGLLIDFCKKEKFIMSAVTHFFQFMKRP
jgi:hypothetical protein